MSTLLADVIRNQTASSLVTVLSRTTDHIAEELALDLLREPEFRAEMKQLVRAAFQQALKDLSASTPPTSTP